MRMMIIKVYIVSYNQQKRVNSWIQEYMSIYLIILIIMFTVLINWNNSKMEFKIIIISVNYNE